MSWPEASASELWVDWSWFNNHGPKLFGKSHKPFDVDAFMELHPETEGAIIRALWPSGLKDPHYDFYYDGFKRNGVHVAAYLWPNPRKSLNAMIEDFKRALGDRMPPLLGYDYEDTSTFEGKSNRELSSLMDRLWDRVHLEWPNSTHVNYSRASWLDAHINTGPWFHEIKWWLAHWIYPPGLGSRQARHWDEINAVLPIDNDWTPWRGSRVRIRLENVVAWQGSAQGKIVPKGYSDLDWFLKSFVGPIYNGGELPPPPPDPELLPIEVVVPARKTIVTVTEVGDG